MTKIFEYLNIRHNLICMNKYSLSHSFNKTYISLYFLKPSVYWCLQYITHLTETLAILRQLAILYPEHSLSLFFMIFTFSQTLNILQRVLTFEFLWYNRLNLVCQHAKIIPRKCHLKIYFSARPHSLIVHQQALLGCQIASWNLGEDVPVKETEKKIFSLWIVIVRRGCIQYL